MAPLIDRHLRRSAFVEARHSVNMGSLDFDNQPLMRKNLTLEALSGTRYEPFPGSAYRDPKHLSTAYETDPTLLPVTPSIPRRAYGTGTRYNPVQSARDGTFPRAAAPAGTQRGRGPAETGFPEPIRPIPADVQP